MAAMNHSTTSQLLSEENCRLETLRNWPGPDINRRDMAKSGLYYDVASGHIVCFSCRIQIENWNRKDIPDEKHAKHSPLCPFVREEISRRAKLRRPTSSYRSNKPSRDFHQEEKRKSPVRENGIQTNTANENDRSEKKRRLPANTQNGETTKVKLEEEKSTELKSTDTADLFYEKVAQTLKNVETRQRIFDLILNEIKTGLSKLPL